MIPPADPPQLSKRERQVIDVLNRLGRATARDIERELPDPPTYSAVRSILRILTNKGIISKERDGQRRDWYAHRTPMAQRRKSAVREFMDRFFGNSAADAACALLGQKNVTLSKAEADKLMTLIKEAKQK